MMRFNLLLSFVFIMLLVIVVEGKKHNKKKSTKENTSQEFSTAIPSQDNKKAEVEGDQDIMRHEITQTSLPAASVAQASLPAATKESDDAISQSGDQSDQNSGEVSGSGEPEKVDETANKPSKVKSKVLYEKDKNKIAETVKKSVQVHAKGKQSKHAASKVLENNNENNKAGPKSTSVTSDDATKKSNGARKDGDDNEEKVDTDETDLKSDAKRGKGAKNESTQDEEKAEVDEKDLKSDAKKGKGAKTESTQDEEKAEVDEKDLKSDAKKDKGAKNESKKDEEKTAVEEKDSKSDSEDSTKDKKVSKLSTSKNKKTGKSSKRSKSSHGHHHHHKHHDKKNKRPSKLNPANEPKKDYPTFDWDKDGKKVNMTARIPGWPGQPSIAQLLALSQMASMTAKSVASWPVGKLINSTINSQADIASVDKASTETTDNSAQRDKTTPAIAESAANDSSSTSENAKLSSDDKNPVAATVASDTGEVPQNISKTADVKVPNNIPNRCAILVKTYSNGELTLKDYLAQLRRCKKADNDFNFNHPFTSSGNALLRNSISKNGEVLTKEAYKYALERMRNYVPSSKEKQAAEQILAKWRSNSFGNRDAASDGIVPDAIKSFMTGQTAIKENVFDQEQTVQAQTDKAMDTAKQFILGTITGRPSQLSDTVPSIKKSEIDTNAMNIATPNFNNAAISRKAMVINPKQSINKVIAAAQSLIGDASKGQAVVLAPSGSSTSLLASVVKKGAVPSPNLALRNKVKALQMAKAAEKLNAALLNQISPNVVTSSEKPGTNLLAALKDMAPGPGPETPVTSPLSIMSSVQKRSILDNTNIKSKRKRRSLRLFVKNSKKSHSGNKRKRRRELIGKASQIDNAIERSKLNKPIIPGPKLMDRIRDMSTIIATP